MIKWLGAVLLLGVLSLGIALFLWFPRFITQDRCLDGGGRWNTATESCEGGAPHVRE